MNAKFTPGPWECRRAVLGLSGDYGIKAPNCENILAEVFSEFRTKGVDDQTAALANARLIAAAPELLGACRAVLNWYEVDSSEFNREMAIAAVRAAIAKATGGDK